MNPHTLRRHTPALRRVSLHVSAHLDEPLALGSLALLAGLSERQLDRAYRRRFGESIRFQHRRLRLERAARQLRGTREPVRAIAAAAGFGSHEAFTRAFRARFGMTPQRYRTAGVTERSMPRRWREALATGLRPHAELLAEAAERRRPGGRVLPRRR